MMTGRLADRKQTGLDGEDWGEVCCLGEQWEEYWTC